MKLQLEDAVCELGCRVPSDTEPASTLTLDFAASRPGRSKCLLSISHPVYCVVLEQTKTESWHEKRCCYNKYLECGISFRTRKWVEARRVLRFMIEKNKKQICSVVKRLLRVTLVKAQKANKKVVAKTSILENIEMVMSKMLAGIWAITAILKRSRNGNEEHIVENWRKDDPCSKV